jgi:hypothetical protein
MTVKIIKNINMAHFFVNHPQKVGFLVDDIIIKKYVESPGNWVAIANDTDIKLVKVS